MNRVEDLINSAKTNELLGELLHIKKEEEKKSNVLMWVAITLGAVLAVAGIAYAVYRFFTPDIWKTLTKISTMIMTIMMMTTISLTTKKRKKRKTRKNNHSM